MSQTPAPPGEFHPRWKHQTGIAVLEHGLPALPAVLDYTMSIPVAFWTATTCAVVLFLEFSRDPDGTIWPVVKMMTFARDSASWTAHRYFGGVGWSHDPIADPQAVRDLGGRAMSGGRGSSTDTAASGHPAAVVVGRAGTAVRQIAFVQDAREERRALHSYFGAWVICTDRWSPYQINALDSNGAVLASLEGPPRLLSRVGPPPQSPSGQGRTT